MPAVCAWLLRLASVVVPRDVRHRWRQQRESSLHSLRILAHRGELVGEEQSCLAWFCRDTLTSAVAARCGELDLRHWLRSPFFTMATYAACVLLICAFTHGFAVTRSLLHALRGPIAVGQEDRLIANLFPVAFALATGILIAIGRVALRRNGWRYLSFLALKTLSLTAIVTLLWFEGGAALRAHIPNEMVRALVGGLVLAAVFVGAFGGCVIWSLADQRRRCPVCLRRLVMPVRIGSWASIFEPVTTEWICDAGHGALCVHEAGTDETADEWIGIEPELVATDSR